MVFYNIFQLGPEGVSLLGLLQIPSTHEFCKNAKDPSFAPLWMLSRLGALRLVLQNATLRALAREQGPCASFMDFRPWIREKCRGFFVFPSGQVWSVPARSC